MGPANGLAACVAGPTPPAMATNNNPVHDHHQKEMSMTNSTLTRGVPQFRAFVYGQPDPAPRQLAVDIAHTIAAKLASPTTTDINDELERLYRTLDHAGINYPRPQMPTVPAVGISDKDLFLLKSMARGDDDTTISRHLAVSVACIRTRRTRLLRKLDATNITHAISMAFRFRWLT